MIKGFKEYKNRAYANIGAVINKSDGSGWDSYKAIVICSECGNTKTLGLRHLDNNIRRAFNTGLKEYISYKCLGCSHTAEHNPNWNNGITISDGYKYLNIKFVDNKEFIDTSKKVVAEHRYIMSNHIGRKLSDNEHVHHINGDRSDNRIENLELLDPATHSAITRMESKWEQRIRDLEEENAKLREQLFELVD